MDESKPAREVLGFVSREVAVRKREHQRAGRQIIRLGMKSNGRRDKGLARDECLREIYAGVTLRLGQPEQYRLTRRKYGQGGVAERLKAAVLKTAKGESPS